FSVSSFSPYQQPYVIVQSLITGSFTVSLDTDVTDSRTYQPPFTINTNAPRSPTRTYDGFVSNGGGSPSSDFTDFFICSCGQQPELTGFVLNIANIFTDTPYMWRFEYLNQPFIYTGQVNPWYFVGDPSSMTLTLVPGPVVGAGLPGL